MKLNPLLLGALAAAGAFAYVKLSKASTVTINGHVWKLIDAGKDGSGLARTNVIAPKGSWGPHEELLVLQFAQSGASRILAGVGQNVPTAMRDAAMVDLGVKPPGA